MPTTKVKREDFLNRLLSVRPGLTAKSTTDQSDNFVFQDGYVLAFNASILCMVESGLPDDWTGAVRAKTLQDYLQGLPDDELTIELRDDQLSVRSASDSMDVRVESEILVQIGHVEKPEEWQPLPDDFLDAVRMTVACTYRGTDRFHLTCVHWTPAFLEACNNDTMMRCMVETGISEKGICVPRDSIKHVVDLGMVEFCETEKWVHFRNRSHLIFSCQLYDEEYDDLTGLTELENAQGMTLPKGIVDRLKRAEVATRDNNDGNLVTVQLRPGKMRVLGDGAYAKYQSKPVLVPSYRGGDLEFFIAPKLLAEIITKHGECEVGDNPMSGGKALRVLGGTWTYVTALATSVDPEEVGGPVPDAVDEQDDGEQDDGDE